MSNTGAGCAAEFEGVRCGKPLQSLVHSFKASGPYFSFNHPYLAPSTVKPTIVERVIEALLDLPNPQRDREYAPPDGVTGEALGRTETERCTFPGCGHTRASHAYGDCLMRPCAAGPHYFNQLHSPTPAPKEEQSAAMTDAERFAAIHKHASGHCWEGDTPACWAAIRELSAPPSPQTEPEIRRNEDGTIDEFIAHGVDVHVEQMNTGYWWISLSRPDAPNERWTLNFYAKNEDRDEITLRAEKEKL